MKLEDGIFTLKSGSPCVLGKRAYTQKSVDRLFAGKSTYIGHIIVPTRNKNGEVTRFVFYSAGGKRLPQVALVLDPDGAWRFTSCVEGPRKVNLAHSLLGMDRQRVYGLGFYTRVQELDTLAARLLLSEVEK